MASLFDIELKYLKLMELIEEQEGELSDEQWKEIQINREDLESKVKAYHHIIIMTNGEIAVATDEMSRLAAAVVTKNKLIERLKKALLEATKIFGTDGKTGNKQLKLDTLKLWTVNSSSVKIASEETFHNEKFVSFGLKTRFGEDDIPKIADLLGVPINNDDKIKFINKTNIKAAIEAGEEIEGAVIIKEPYIRYS